MNLQPDHQDFEVAYAAALARDAEAVRKRAAAGHGAGNSVLLTVCVVCQTPIRSEARTPSCPSCRASGALLAWKRAAHAASPEGKAAARVKADRDQWRAGLAAEKAAKAAAKAAVQHRVAVQAAEATIAKLLAGVARSRQP